MTNSHQKCNNKDCGAYHRTEDMLKLPNNRYVCDNECAMGIVIADRIKRLKQAEKQVKRAKKAKVKKENAYWLKKKRKLVTRAQRYNRLQILVNQYVTKVRDKNKGCCTCKTSKPDIKYDAGHLFTQKARPDIRFDLHNIHKQCSVNCNQHGSGMRAEYKDFVVDTYGQDELDRLECEGLPLKEQFPTTQDIESEIIRYRKLLRDNDIRPNI